MKLDQMTVDSIENLHKLRASIQSDFDFGLVFAAPQFFKSPELLKTFVGLKSPVIGCSTAGEITGQGLHNDSLTFTTVKFEKGSHVRKAAAQMQSVLESRKVGEKIGLQLKDPQLKLVFVLSAGLNVNGSELVRGIEQAVGPGVSITGGLAGDNGEFKTTYTFFDGETSSQAVIALGFFGSDLKIGFGSQGGWKAFGPARKVTKVDSNILYELDGQSALKVYETYLGDKAKDLPASGLLYPFAIISENDSVNGLIRTILGIDKEKGSLTLAGDVPMGGTLRLMHAGNDGLIAGAEAAAEMSKGKAGAKSENSLAILVSCVGRKLVLGQDTDDEIDAVKGVLPSSTCFTGFYSYGEICPFENSKSTMLHNQTMTITYLSE